MQHVPDRTETSPQKKHHGMQTGQHAEDNREGRESHGPGISKNNGVGEGVRMRLNSCPRPRGGNTGITEGLGNLSGVTFRTTPDEKQRLNALRR